MKSNSLLRYALRVLFSCVLITMFWGVASANNIRIIGKPIITDQDTVKNTVLIKFDIAWDNSWKTSKPANHDAAWIFVKCWDGEAWNHVYLDDNTVDKNSFKAGSTNAADAVNKGVTYSVTDREGKVKNMAMVLEPGYSMAWKQWHLDPTEKAVQCVVGYFLYREEYGAGHIVVPGVTFKWNYGNQGFVDEDDLVVKVFAVEMVYVPTGSYYLGGKGTADWQAYSFTTNGNTFGTPMVVTSENAITVDNTSSPNTLWAYDKGDPLVIMQGTLPAEYPKGYQAFYIMKYEMTQQAYCEFLNTLNQGQQDGRIEGTLSALGVRSNICGWDGQAYRHHIYVKQAAPVALFGMDANGNSIFDETDKVKYDDRDTLIRNIDGQDLAVNFVSFFDLLAYAEFSGLRPMTELEYEKACRGPREPVNDEYAWGSVTKVFFAYPFHNNAGGYYSYRSNGQGDMWDVNTGTEKVNDYYNSGIAHGYTWSNGWWNVSHYYYPAPLRVGLFADSTSTRAAAGATFWGVMNMSDNLAEMCISATDTLGRRFQGVHGCGQLDGNGDAMNEDWHISAQPNYFIIKGMNFHYWSNTWGNAARSNRVNSPELWYGGTTADHGWFQAGMVSSRYYCYHNVPGTRRDYTASGDVIRGIRCVRTAGAAK